MSITTTPQDKMQLNREDILVGDTAARGEQSWHYNATNKISVANHYTGAIPVQDVLDKLFHWTPVEVPFDFPYFTAEGDLRQMSDPKRKVLVRPDLDLVLGVPAATYKGHGYAEWLVDSWGQVLDSDEVHISAAGMLGHGKTGWVEISRESFTTVAGIEVRPFIIAASSFDQTLSTTFKEATTLAVCWNTLEAAMGEAGRIYKKKHTSKSKLEVLAIRDALGIMESQHDAVDAAIEKLLAEPVSDERFDRFVEAYAGTAKAKEGRGQTIANTKARELKILWRDSEMVAPWAGTAFGVLQAANTYNHHINHLKDADGDAIELKNVERVLNGDNAKNDARALEILASV